MGEILKVRNTNWTLPWLGNSYQSMEMVGDSLLVSLDKCDRADIPVHHFSGTSKPPIAHSTQADQVTWPFLRTSQLSISTC